MMTPVKVRPAEWLHEKCCLARAIICAVENLRDDEGEGDLTFRLAMQDGFELDEADSYLRTGTIECVCSAPWPDEPVNDEGTEGYVNVAYPMPARRDSTFIEGHEFLT